MSTNGHLRDLTPSCKRRILSTVPMLLDHRSRCRCGMNIVSHRYPCSKCGPIIMELELLLCTFVRSLRNGDFSFYFQVCDELCSYLHVMDNANNARQLPVHVRDMIQMSDTHSDINAKFMEGNFVIQKSAHTVSLIVKDQSHKQSVWK